MSSVLLVKTAVRGYHVYQGVWEPRRGDLFVSLHESENRHDRYAMAVYHSDVPGIVVGHLPKEISKMCYYFIRHDGKISGKVTGGRKYSEEAGGMEIPCELRFSGSARKVRKLRQLLTDLDSPVVVVVSSL